MKFLSSLSILSAMVTSASALTAGSQQKEMYHYNKGAFSGPTMWILGSTGLRIYSPDGSNELVSTPPEDICHNVTGYRGGPPSLSCSFYDVVSDGKKFVWAAVSRGVSKIDVFDIDTGGVVGSFETCATPRDLEYHPLRDEIWVRCMGANDEYSGYMDVFSVSSPTGDTIANIDLTGNHTFSAYGYSVIDNTLGDVGYASSWNKNILTKYDLSERRVLEQFELPNAYGAYEVAYSPINKHIFVRASVCCSCGFEGSDMGEDCGRYGSDNVTITTGPNAGKVMPGQCGRCDGLPIDNIGVYEFDTQTDTIIGHHVMDNGSGGDPFASPDGRHIVLVGRNGGEVLRIIEAGKNGEKSTILYDLELGFSTTDQEDSAVYNDFAFIQTTQEEDGVKRDMIVIAAGTENTVALVDLLVKDSSGNPKVTKITLSSSEEVTARRSRRQVEWVIGTDYVWIDGTDAEEVYVVDLDKKTSKTITGFTTSKMLSVENYERKRIAKIVADQVKVLQVTDDSDKKSVSETSTASSASLTQPAMEADSDKTDAVGVAALIVGLCAIVVGIANMVAMTNMKKKQRFCTNYQQ